MNFETIEDEIKAAELGQSLLMTNFTRTIMFLHNIVAEGSQRHKTNLIKEIAVKSTEMLKSAKKDLEKGSETYENFIKDLTDNSKFDNDELVQKVVDTYKSGIDTLCELIEKEEGFKFGEKNSFEQLVEAYEKKISKQ